MPVCTAMFCLVYARAVFLSSSDAPAGVVNASGLQQKESSSPGHPPGAMMGCERALSNAGQIEADRAHTEQRVLLHSAAGRVLTGIVGWAVSEWMVQQAAATPWSEEMAKVR
jgi:hypothetical protein